MKIAAMLRLVKLTETYSGNATTLGRRCKQKKKQVQTDNSDLESKIGVADDDDQNHPVISEKTFEAFKTAKVSPSLSDKTNINPF
jgi:hypothetical protein